MPQGLTDEQLNAMAGGQNKPQGLTDEQLNALESGGGSPTPSPTPPQPGFFERIAGDYASAAKNIVSDVLRPGDLRSQGASPLKIAGAVGEAGLRTAGNFAGAVFAPVAELPPVKWLTDKVVGALGPTGGLGPNGQKAAQAVSDWATKHPEAAKDLQSVVNIAGALGGLKGGAGVLSKDVQTLVPEAIGGVKKAVTGVLSGKGDLNSIYDVVKPKLSSAEEASAKASGKITSAGGLKNTVEMKPDLEMAQYAKDAGVRSGNTFDKNIAVMKQAIKKSADTVRSQFRSSDAIWNKNELKGVLSKVEMPISLTQPDLPIADKMKQGILKLVDEANKKPEGILDVRQKFDDLVEKNFGTKIFGKTDPKGILVKNFRKALNDFGESKLGTNNTVKQEWRRMTKLYDAIDNVAENAPKVGESARPVVGKVRSFVKKHPVISGAAVGVPGYEAAKELGVPLP